MVLKKTMPLPVAHSLLGASLVAAVLPRDVRPRHYLPLAAGAVLANAPDLDFILVFASGSRSWHRGFTHSIAFALAVALTFLLALGRRRARKAAAYGLAFASHAFLDFVTTKEGGGLTLLWPFSAERMGLRWFGLSELPSGLPPAELLKSAGLELLLFAPPFLLLLWWRRGVGGKRGADV